MDPATARSRLERLLADLDSSASALAAEHAGDSSELSHFDQHQADTASEMFDKDREDAMFEVVASQRRQVLEALARIDDGSYGRCVDCGQPLPEERLEARPEAARCVSCQSRSEGAR